MTTAFAKVGFSGDFGSHYFLHKLVGTAKARELYFTAEILSADQIEKLGLANRVIDDANLDRETMAFAKKLAAGLDALVMDVKVGSGAFLPTRAAASELALSIVEVARGNRLPTSALLTDMDRVLGRTAGNAVEVRESIDQLTGVLAAGLRRPRSGIRLAHAVRDSLAQSAEDGVKKLRTR